MKINIKEIKKQAHPLYELVIAFDKLSEKHRLDQVTDEEYSKKQASEWVPLGAVEALETQLRQEIKKNQSELERTSSSDPRHCGFLAGCITSKKEVLGEVDKP